MLHTLPDEVNENKQPAKVNFSESLLQQNVGKIKGQPCGYNASQSAISKKKKKELHINKY